MYPLNSEKGAVNGPTKLHAGGKHHVRQDLYEQNAEAQQEEQMEPCLVQEAAADGDQLRFHLVVASGLSLRERALRLARFVQAYSNLQVVFAIIGYTVCSSCMLVINKVTIFLVPAPSLVLAVQLLFSTLFVIMLSSLQIVEADRLEWKKVKAFWLVSFAFLFGIYANIKTLQYANVETFIVIRSCTPLVIAVMDYLFLARELPSTRSVCVLLLVIAGATGYVMTDANFEIRAYTWVGIWMCLFTFDQIYIKHVCDTVHMTTWGRVYYTNLIALIPITALGIVVQEWRPFQEMSVYGAVALVTSSLMGLAMNYCAYLLRALISATSFTVVGTLCKILSVIINVLIWDKHATPLGLAYLYLCLLAGTFYQQAPLRKN